MRRSEESPLVEEEIPPIEEEDKIILRKVGEVVGSLTPMTRRL